MKKRIRDSFRTPLVVEVMPSGKRFKLHYDFTYYWKRYGVKVHVPAGFETDFASIPRPVRFIIPKLGRYNKAAVLHDRLYQNHRVDSGDKRWFYVFPRYFADLLFLDAMIDLGVVKWKRLAMYYAVRAFGWLAWRK